MSNSLAIATVTATLRHLLGRAVKEVNGALATTVRPASSESDVSEDLSNPGVNIYLYQVTPNAAWRNDDLPTRREDGSVIQHPRAALDLNYLLTFHGNENRLEPQRVMGCVIRTLHSTPLLTRQEISDAIKGSDFLEGSDLADEVKQIKITPINLSLEEMSKIWSVFFQTPYFLSVAYRASLIFIDGRDMPSSALPVRQRNIRAIAFPRQPAIEQLLTEEGPGSPILADSTLIIRGKNLQGDRTTVRAGEEEAEPETVNDSEIRLNLSAFSSLKAGVLSLQVIHRKSIVMSSDPSVVRSLGRESNVAAFVLHPVIKGKMKFSKTEETAGAIKYIVSKVTAKVKPDVGESQRVFLALNLLSYSTSASYIFPEDRRDIATDSVSFTLSRVEKNGNGTTVPQKGTYLARLQVDGAFSVLKFSDDPETPGYTEPTVKIE
ncbi:MAG TPA: DUF4255 domain-containing protein [Methanothrix sp.]|nr:DUF4255 domain-containing protein [Methanothrix sp.]